MLVIVRMYVVGGEALEIAHGHGFVDLFTVALPLAGVVADAPAHCRQWAAFAN